MAREMLSLGMNARKADIRIKRRRTRFEGRVCHAYRGKSTDSFRF